MLRRMHPVQNIERIYIMGIHFDESRWEKIKNDYDLWWEGKLDRPLINLQVEAYEPDRPEPAAPLLTQETALDLSWSADDLIDRIDYELSKIEYLGDSYPYFNMDCFGPGVLAAFLGADADNSSGRIWFSVPEEKELCDMHFAYQPDNVWFNRVKDIYRAANRRWHGRVIMGMVDLGGVMDCLAIFRGTNNLLMDLYDEPDEVKRLSKELHQLWMRYYNELCSVMEEENIGYSDWSHIFSSKRSYIIQSDFCFMISHDMFKEFIMDELRQCTEELENTIYHLDGPGELKHLDTILTFPKLNAVQWVPGAGAPDQCNWPEVYQKIHAAGKGIQIWDGYDSIRAVEKQIGTGKGIHHFFINGTEPAEKLEYHKKMLKEFGVE